MAVLSRRRRRCKTLWKTPARMRLTGTSRAAWDSCKNLPPWRLCKERRFFHPFDSRYPTVLTPAPRSAAMKIKIMALHLPPLASLFFFFYLPLVLSVFSSSLYILCQSFSSVYFLLLGERSFADCETVVFVWLKARITDDWSMMLIIQHKLLLIYLMKSHSKL